MPDNYYFVSYSRHDALLVHRVVEELQARDIPIWLDTMLVPGENWETAIHAAVERAEGVILFVSQASLRQAFVQQELSAADSGTDFILPVLLEDVDGLPLPVANVQWIDGRGEQDAARIERIVAGLVGAIDQPAARGRQAAVPAMRANVAVADPIIQASVAKVRGAESAPPADAVAPDSVFIVHGHDLDLLDEVEQYIAALGITPIVLTKISNAEQSLWQKFINFSNDVRFAVVLISADDWGASRRQFDPPDGVGERALQFRARQNVILELGFFYGRLDWEHVFVLYKPPSDVFPNFERPSDLAGAVFDEVDPDGRWKTLLAERLRSMGFNIP